MQYTIIWKWFKNHYYAKDLIYKCKMHVKKYVLNKCSNITSFNELKILLKFAI